VSRSKYRKKKERNIPYTYLFVIALIAVVLYLVVGNPFAQAQENTIAFNPPSSLSDVPTLTGSSLALHFHVHLDIYVNGSHETIPVTWGVGNHYYAIHTHDTSGVIHIESPISRNFTLGEIFEVFGYPTFDATHCLNYSNVPVKVYVDGKQNSSYANITLTSHQEIAVLIGSKQPSAIPSSYNFPSDLTPYIPIASFLLYVFSECPWRSGEEHGNKTRVNHLEQQVKAS
jgi:hypothetical protein